VNHKEMGCKDVDCVCLAEDGDHWWVGCCEQCNKLSGALKFREFVG
jgi:hypothetical protein